MTGSDIEQLLYDAALAQAIVNRRQLGNGADLHFRSVAATAAQQIAAIDNDEESRDKTAQALRAFQRLVDMMIEVREEAYRGQPERLAGNIVGEDTLGMALGRLCPGLWPFC